MFKKSSIILFLAALLLIFFSIRLIITPSPENKAARDGSFDVSLAYSHLQQIARAPHSIGTPEHARVRAYIETVCRDLGLVVEVQHTTGLVTQGNGLTAGNVYNIIARLKGQDNSKTVLVAAHYDSQPNAVGAGDDGAGVAAMLETARVLKSGKRLKNDILFLFTDGEEDGLLGATGFVQNSPILKEVGMVLNFDNRGNAGIVTMFETNPGNGWVISGYSHAAAHPFANSLNYEVYKVLPNSTDYTVFKAAGIAGLNNAFIEGFVNYHSMTDRPENLDRGTFQSEGDDMLSLVRYFGDSKIQETKRADVTYFNVIGTWMVRYPASLNIVFLAVGNLLLIAFLIIGIRRKKVRVGGLVAGFFLFPVTLFILYELNHFFVLGIRSAYPLYDHFYGSNSYNAYYYFFGMAALGLAVFSLIYQWVLRKLDLASILGSILLVEMIATDFVYTVAPTAVYFLLFPLISLLAGYLLLFRKGRTDPDRASALLPFIFVIPAILLLSPIVYFTFVAFGLSDEVSAVVIILGLFLGLLLPLLAGVFRMHRWIIPAGAFVCLLVSLVLAHLHAGYTDKEPLQTNLRYLADADKQKAYWTSNFEAIDHWDRPFFNRTKVAETPVGFYRGLINEAPYLDLAAPVMSLQKDTVEEGLRKMTFHCQAREGAISARILLSDPCPAYRVMVDGKEDLSVRDEKHVYRTIDYIGLGKEGFDLVLEIAPKSSLDLFFTDRSLGLPEVKGFNTVYPAGVIPGPDHNSNTIQVIKHYRF